MQFIDDPRIDSHFPINHLDVGAQVRGVAGPTMAVSTSGWANWNPSTDSVGFSGVSSMGPMPAIPRALSTYSASAPVDLDSTPHTLLPMGRLTVDRQR